MSDRPVSPAAVNGVTREYTSRTAVAAVTRLPYFLGRPRTNAIVIAMCCFNIVADPSWVWKAVAVLVALQEAWAASRVLRVVEALRGPVRQVVEMFGVRATAATCEEVAGRLRDRLRNGENLDRTQIEEAVAESVLYVARAASHFDCCNGHRPLCRHVIGAFDRASDDPLVQRLIAELDVAAPILV